MTDPNMLGFVGVGVMGEKMCQNMAIKAGKPVLAFDQNKEPLQRLSEHGVESANSLSDVMARTDMVFLLLDLPCGSCPGDRRGCKGQRCIFP